MSHILDEFAYLYGKPKAKAIYKECVEDFQVTEELGYDLSGSGEHLCVLIEKSSENTRFVANELAKACGVKSRDVSWVGLKDRHALTRQWFSVYLPKGDPDLEVLEEKHPNIKVIQIARHHKKLRTGELQGNYFVIRLTHIQHLEELKQRIKLIESGVPNYFGIQRFGYQGDNLKEARRWGRDNVRTRNNNQRSLYLSSARSWIFNRIVSQRIKSGHFSQVLQGDYLSSGELVNEQNHAELNEKSLYITAALVGDNQLPTQGQALALEQNEVDREPDLMSLIRNNRMQHDRRAICLVPEALEWAQYGDDIVLSFFLPSGAYATSVIRELAHIEEPVRTY